MNSPPNKRLGVKGYPAEFFLPPPTNAALWNETLKVLGGSFAFMVVLGIVVALTQGVVLKV